MVVLRDYKLNMEIPLGTTEIDDVVLFGVQAEQKVTLHVELEGKTTDISMEKGRNGINYAAVRLTENERRKLVYFYTGEKGVIPDPYARRVVGRQQFGKKTVGKLKFMLSDFNGKWGKDENLHKVKDISELILYKLHVRGFTAHESSHVKHPGTFLGVTEKLRYLTKLGITGVLLQPVVEFDEILPNGMVNFWGYNCQNTYNFALKTTYAVNSPGYEFAVMVEKLHKAGIDVYLEMLFTDNTPISEMLDVLRFYYNFYHVDGFRINDYQIDLGLLVRDPYLGNCRFFVTNADGRLLDSSKGRVVRLNDGFMNDARRFIKGDEGMVPALFEYMKTRDYRAGVRYIADHNGFSLNDLYSYDVRHNEANNLGGTDGNDYNFSWNCGVEGETSLKKIRALRTKMIKNALTLTFLSGGVPLLVAGDEFLHTKKGNNNTFCQDNELSYLDWKNAVKNREILDYVRFLIALRQDNLTFRAVRVLSEGDYAGIGFPEISFHGVAPWRVDYQSYNRLAGIYISGKFRLQGETIEGNDYYLIFNMHWEPHKFSLPDRNKKKYYMVSDTARKKVDGEALGRDLMVAPRSIVILICK